MLARLTNWLKYDVLLRLFSPYLTQCCSIFKFLFCVILGPQLPSTKAQRKCDVQFFYVSALKECNDTISAYRLTWMHEHVVSLVSASLICYEISKQGRRKTQPQVFCKKDDSVFCLCRLFLVAKGYTTVGSSPWPVFTALDGNTAYVILHY